MSGGRGKTMLQNLVHPVFASLRSSVQPSTVSGRIAGTLTYIVKMIKQMMRTKRFHANSYCITFIFSSSGLFWSAWQVGPLLRGDHFRSDSANYGEGFVAASKSESGFFKSCQTITGNGRRYIFDLPKRVRLFKRFTYLHSVFF